MAGKKIDREFADQSQKIMWDLALRLIHKRLLKNISLNYFGNSVNSALLLVHVLMHCGLGGALLGKEFMHEVLFFVNRLREVLIKLIGAIFFIAVMNKAHAVT